MTPNNDSIRLYEVFTNINFVRLAFCSYMIIAATTGFLENIMTDDRSTTESVVLVQVEKGVRIPNGR